MSSRSHLDMPTQVLLCRQAVEAAGAAAWGPITQADLLQNLGIGPRLEALVGSCPDPVQQEALYQGALRLVSASSQQVRLLFLVSDPAPAWVQLGASWQSNAIQPPLMYGDWVDAVGIIAALLAIMFRGCYSIASASIRWCGNRDGAVCRHWSRYLVLLPVCVAVLYRGSLITAGAYRFNKSFPVHTGLARNWQHETKPEKRGGALAVLSRHLLQEEGEQNEKPGDGAEEAEGSSFAPHEGFGTSFKCLAVTRQGLAPPFPFQDH